MKYTNRTQRSIAESVKEYQLGLTSNYAVIKDEPNEFILDNLTAPTDARELIGFRYRKIGNVNTDLDIQYPGRVKSGVNYAIQLEETVSDENVTTGDRYDYPLVMYLTVRHPNIGAVSDELLAETFERLCSIIRDSQGTYIFNRMARGALRPKED